MRIMLYILIMVSIMLMPGCANFSNVDVRSSYFSPQWSPQGEIICIKNRMAVSGGKGGGFGGSGTSFSPYYYLTRLNPSDFTERDLLFIGSDLIGIGELSLSPLGNYYVYKTYKKLNIISSNGDLVINIALDDEYASFDWAPDESKLVLLKNGILNIVDRASGNIILISTIEAYEPSWRYAEKIVFYGKQNDIYYLSFIRPDGTGLEMTTLTLETTGAYPQYSPDGSKVYTIWTNYIRQIDASTKSIVNTTIASNDSFAHKISPDGTKLLGEDDNIWNYYIFTTDLDGSNRKNIVTW
ncbi:MAG: hypothetical protein A2664_00190 [Candidatus Taylorbacteria bacterium RIFCSPHIGHO2_01_FULL_46_22b]|uniref:DUF5050 domain-containing protein n=1 Tax=Candidatus Taylorbacteria bacterium RIFCSPHIGHO2_01_FULL_46_22b TaxID=1802301 RepID=A0A1G2M6L9_9BACT|nr:MAG: hypothetical protein A2664_00190 [Candidatus Taylorbacteria bacterium RIFCSPHIGHO2_01_FULL_46_22b]